MTTNLTPMRMRANTINSDTELQGCDIKIDAYYNGTDTKYIDGAKLHYNSSWMFWEDGEPGSQEHYCWPIEGSVYDPAGENITVSSLDFVGYCPYTAPSYITSGPSYTAGNISFTAIMPTIEVDEVTYMADQASMNEYLVAIAANKTYADQGGSGVPMVFKHPLAYIKFSLSEATTDNVTVNSISMVGLKTSGSCSFNGTTSTWTSQDGSAAMNLTETLQRHETEETSPFLVIPNNYGEKTLSVNATWTEWGEVQTRTFEAPLTIDWVAGYAYTYTLTITKYELIVDVAKFTEQW